LEDPIMRLFSAGVLLLSLVLSGASISVQPAQTTSLRFVSTPWPPFTNEAGQPRFALDLVEAALGRIGLQATTTLVEPARFTAALLSEDFDGSAAAWKDPERERLLTFSQPYLENRLILIGRPGDDVSATSLATLTGKRIALVEGYSYGDAIANAGLMLVKSRSEEDSLRLLLDNKADHALMDELVVQYLLNNYPNEAKAKLNVGTRSLLTRALYVAVRRSRPDAASIIERFNAQLRGMIADRTYHRLLQVSWIRADVDGDGLAEFVPKSDLSGPAAPQHAYSLFTADPVPTKRVESPSRFYVGGSIYTDWASVPNRYKVEDPNWPSSNRSTASIFKFVW
jgi:polar amino acid transport system substrate-binding protein